MTIDNASAGEYGDASAGREGGELCHSVIVGDLEKKQRTKKNRTDSDWGNYSFKCEPKVRTVDEAIMTPSTSHTEIAHAMYTTRQPLRVTTSINTVFVAAFTLFDAST